ncbi:hypothetical protein Slin15195_G112840 [Septoria linicola]|uniref:Uncharacterized protein n=1 Tax=Septoria linicola TaxID=215465 RepID=A0A9Q9AZI2_9PEZI|nr:hypothetical protein Slin15195_G112840 [Septoria linicola]
MTQMDDTIIEAEVWTNADGSRWERTTENLTERFSNTAVARIVFLEARELKQDSPEDEHRDTERRHQSIRSTLGMPATFWSPMLQDASGFFRAVEQRNAAGGLVSRETWLRLLIKHVARGPEHNNLSDDDKSGPSKIRYDWHRLGMFGRWWPGGRFEIFCFDFPTGLKEEIIAQLKVGTIPTYLTAPLGPHAWLLEQIVPWFDRSVWRCRDIVRGHEKQRPKIIRGDSNSRAEQYYEDLHELARHAVHVTEMLVTALNVLSMVIEEQTSLESTDQRPSDGKAIEKTLRYLKSLLQGFHPRAQALEQRLTSETNLLFHLTNQDIATSAQKDSAATRTISFLGLIFLPGTLISAIFSTSFFNYSPGDDLEWRVSDKFWIYWAVAAPVTLLTYLFWQYWSAVMSTKRNHKESQTRGGRQAQQRINGLFHRQTARHSGSSSAQDLEMQHLK